MLVRLAFVTFLQMSNHRCTLTRTPGTITGINCECSAPQPAERMTCTHPRNAGRQYYRCASSSRDAGCAFFIWADEANFTAKSTSEEVQLWTCQCGFDQVSFTWASAFDTYVQKYSCMCCELTRFAQSQSHCSLQNGVDVLACFQCCNQKPISAVTSDVIDLSGSVVHKALTLPATGVGAVELSAIALGNFAIPSKAGTTDIGKAPHPDGAFYFKNSGKSKYGPYLKCTAARLTGACGSSHVHPRYWSKTKSKAEALGSRKAPKHPAGFIAVSLCDGTYRTTTGESVKHAEWCCDHRAENKLVGKLTGSLADNV